MKRECCKKLKLYKRTGENGQTITVVVLVLGLFLLGALGLAVDFSQLWFHRQIAQAAADATCTAGAMDLLVNAQGGSMGGFPVGSPPAAFLCSSAASAATCKYAKLNGYNGTGRVAGEASNDVRISFPGSVPGVTPPPATLAPTPFIRVNVFDRARVIFAGMLMGSRTVDVAATATCGLLQAKSPIPIIVLNPTCQHTFQLSGSTNVKIVGGPPRSIQVNSNNTSCAAATTNAPGGCSANGPTIDLSKGGPNFNGSTFGVFGAPTTPPAGFTGAHWGPGSPIQDPYERLTAPDEPLTPSSTDGNPLHVGYGIDGCPDHTQLCDKYLPGLYNNPIVVKNVTAIFEPGVYYIKGTQNDNCGDPGTPAPGSGCPSKPTGQCRYGLDVDSNGVVRPASVGGSYSDGTMFYLSGTGSGSYGSVFFGANAGKSGGRNVDAFTTSNAVCPGGDSPPNELNLPPTVPGNVLLGQCTSKGTFVGASVDGQTDTAGAIRGLLFFQNRDNKDVNGQGSMQGGGGLVLSGNMYFHNCSSPDGAGAGTRCPWPTAGFNSFYQLQGSSGGDAYVLGNITTDELVLGGGGNISMLLNPNAVLSTLKVSLLQ